MSAEASVRASVRRLPFADIDDFSHLFRDYCAEYDTLSEFYAGDYRREADRRDAVERAIAVDRDRETLADVLQEQNERWGLSDATQSNIEALRRSDTAAVVTGQQVGLFTGPIYTFLKALSTIQLAKQLTKESGHEVVPVFWLGGEDHDFAEISKVLLFRRNDPVTLDYEARGLAENGNTGPVGRIVMDGQIDDLVDRLDDILPPTDFKPDVMEIVRNSYRAGETFSDAFARLIQSLFGDFGLVILSSDDERLKHLAKPLFQREVADAEEVAERIGAVSSSLAERYHEQVHVKPANLFIFNERGRFAIDFVDGEFAVRDHDQRFSRQELHDLIENAPERFSPNVVMRPLTQDLLLPTAMYVAGPGEIAYFGQYRGVYDWAGLPMPLIYPRASVTFMEGKVAKVLEKYGLKIGDFSGDLDRLFQRVVVDAMEVDLDELFGDASRHLHQAVNEVKSPLESIDRTLSKSVEATRQSLMEAFEALKGKAVRLEKKNQDVVRDQLDKAKTNLFPEGTFQERAISILYYLNKYGLGLVKELEEIVSTDTTAHQVVEL